MEFFGVVEKRRSTRKFKDQPIEKEKLDRILETINAAPSAHNLQAYELYLVETPEKKRELSVACRGQKWVKEAPIDLVFCTNIERRIDREPSRGKFYAMGDAFIACSYAQLAAVDLGLACVWIGAFEADQVSKVLELPSSLEPVAVLPIGYAAEEPTKEPRRGVEDLVKKRL